MVVEHLATVSKVSALFILTNCFDKLKVDSFTIKGFQSCQKKQRKPENQKTRKTKTNFFYDFCDCYFFKSADNKNYYYNSLKAGIRKGHAGSQVVFKSLEQFFDRGEIRKIKVTVGEGAYYFCAQRGAIFC